jgi:hypothetical protein
MGVFDPPEFHAIIDLFVTKVGASMIGDPKELRTLNEPTGAAPCAADFSINGQHNNIKIAAPAIVMLQADEAQATRYQWEVVVAFPPDAYWTLTGGAQAQATLAVVSPGAYVIQLAVEKGESNAVTRGLLQVVASRRASGLAAAGEPLRFPGDEARSGLPDGFGADGTSDEARELVAVLASKAVEIVQEFKLVGRLPVRPGASVEELEEELATAWLLAEVTRRGLAVSHVEIVQAVKHALEETREGSYLHQVRPTGSPPSRTGAFPRQGL